MNFKLFVNIYFSNNFQDDINIICNIIKERREESGRRHFRRCKSISQLRTLTFNSFSTLFNTPVIVDKQLYYPFKGRRQNNPSFLGISP